MERVKARTTHWAYWAGGALLSTAALGLTTMGVEHYASMGVVTLLFCWGTLLAERTDG